MLTDLADTLGVSESVIMLLGLVIVAQLAVEIAALVSLARRKPEAVLWKKRWLWLIIILFVGNGLGAILYFVVGREDPPVAQEVEARHDVSAKAGDVADLLYGPADEQDRS